jgi:hypothetical protein
MDKKYALYPGYVISQYDGDRHFISASQLAELYGVNFNECVIVDKSRPESMVMRGHTSDLIPLFPRMDGKYKKPPNKTV